MFCWCPTIALLVLRSGGPFRFSGSIGSEGLVGLREHTSAVAAASLDRLIMHTAEFMHLAMYLLTHGAGRSRSACQRGTEGSARNACRLHRTAWFNKWRPLLSKHGSFQTMLLQNGARPHCREEHACGGSYISVAIANKAPLSKNWISNTMI